MHHNRRHALVDRRRSDRTDRRLSVSQDRGRTAIAVWVTTGELALPMSTATYVRRHESGVRTEVHAHPRLTFTVRAVRPDGSHAQLQTRGTVADAQDRADWLSQCPQPCQCPQWN
jgi:hypothetical protein